MIYPWQKKLWQQLVTLLHEDRLPHALLFAGQDYIGKRQLAQCFANLCLCDAPKDDLPCGVCKACQWVKAGSHSDIKIVSLEEKATAIKVDQIREISTYIQQTPQSNKMKLVLIMDADKMNVAASNALLKSLEEPNSHTIFILIAKAPSLLLPTISSRCQKWTLPVPTEKEALEYLPASDEAVFVSVKEGLLALAKKQSSVVDLASKWQSYDFSAVLDALLLWVTQYIKLNAHKDTKRLFNFYERLLALKAMRLKQVNLNQQLALEEALFVLSSRS